MLQLNLPPYNIKVKNENGQRKIFDILRRKYLVITPEEWVRQHFIHYLIEHKNYPMGLLLIVSNGIDTYICKMDYEHQTYTFLPSIPDYKEL